MNSRLVTLLLSLSCFTHPVFSSNIQNPGLHLPTTEGRKRKADDVVDLTDGSANQPTIKPAKTNQSSVLPAWMRVLRPASDKDDVVTFTSEELEMRDLIRPKNDDGSSKTDEQILNDPKIMEDVKNFLLKYGIPKLRQVLQFKSIYLRHRLFFMMLVLVLGEKAWPDMAKIYSASPITASKHFSALQGQFNNQVAFVGFMVQVLNMSQCPSGIEHFVEVYKSLKQESINATFKFFDFTKWSPENRTAIAFYSVKLNYKPFIDKIYAIDPDAFTRSMVIGGANTSIYSVVSDPELLRWLIKNARMQVPVNVHIEGCQIPFIYHFLSSGKFLNVIREFPWSQAHFQAAYAHARQFNNPLVTAFMQTFRINSKGHLVHVPI